MGKGATPDPPNYDEAARQGVYADLETYPMRYLTEAASKMGGKVTIDGKEYDFTGLGDADNSAVMSDKMAAALLDLQKNLGPQFVRQRIDELKQADPQGYAMRKDLFDRIMAQTEANPDRPMADDLQASITSELQNAGKLDSSELRDVQQAVRGSQVRNNNFLGNSATAQEAEATVKAGEGLRDQQQQQALGYLESGVTPEDVKYRRLQQSMANMGAFIGGETPTAQFQQVSGASAGAVPFTTTSPNSQATNPTAAGQGVNNALNIYRGNVNWYQNQVNPYAAGISTGISTLNAGMSLGARPGFTAGVTPGYQGVQLQNVNGIWQ